jgi:hypothetical protein
LVEETLLPCKFPSSGEKEALFLYIAIMQMDFEHGYVHHQSMNARSTNSNTVFCFHVELTIVGLKTISHVGQSGAMFVLLQ